MADKASPGKFAAQSPAAKNIWKNMSPSHFSHAHPNIISGRHRLPTPPSSGSVSERHRCGAASFHPPPPLKGTQFLPPPPVNPPDPGPFRFRAFSSPQDRPPLPR